MQSADEQPMDMSDSKDRSSSRRNFRESIKSLGSRKSIPRSADGPGNDVDQVQVDEVPVAKDDYEVEGESETKRPASGIFKFVSGIYQKVFDMGPMAKSEFVSKGGENRIVKLNVGGELFSTTAATLTSGRSMFLKEIMEAAPEALAYDDDHNIFIDHDSQMFKLILNYLRSNTPVALPEMGSREWLLLRLDVDFFVIDELATRMDALAQEASKQKETSSLDAAEKLLQKQGRELERMRVELHRLQFEKEKAASQGLPIFSKMEFAYNLMVVGVTGHGKSSTLNTILDNPQACLVSGSQGQGTRGCQLKDGVIDDKHFVSYLDTQGLGADTNVSDEELLEQIMLSTESIQTMGIINNILISYDLTSRTTPSSMANLLTLCEIFKFTARSCFVCFSKFNTNSVLSEWNMPLRKWIQKYRRTKNIEDIKTEPPTYAEMYDAYTQYLIKSLANKFDGGAFAKIATFLTFFESRVLWMFNLDQVEIEDKEFGDLEPYKVYLYEFYRKKALVTLKRGSTRIVTAELAFLQDDEDTMRMVAGRLVTYRDEKIKRLESVGLAKDKRMRFIDNFTAMTNLAKKNMEKKSFDVNNKFSKNILVLIGEKEDVPVMENGCLLM